jgi:signal transduction histidine kinase
MLQLLAKAIDYFIPDGVRVDSSGLMKIRTFIFLHLMGPAMGQSVILFLYRASRPVGWQFWVLETAVTSFWIVPFIVKNTQTLFIPAFVSVQVLVFISLLGSFYYGGISSPFLPWLLIALLIGFFYLADKTIIVLAGVTVQLAVFVGLRLYMRNFAFLVPLESLMYVNLISIFSALIYITLLSMYYENVMRASAGLEQATLEQRLHAEQLREAMRLAETASQQKSIFLAKMSHELRTPLNAVIGYSEMLRDALEGNPDHKQRTIDLERINSAGRHLLELVTDVLDLSSIEANRLELSMESVNVSELVREVLATAAPLIAKKDNRLVLQIAGDLGVINTDPLKLRQSMLNLLSNAAKFTSRGTITLTVMKRKAGSAERLLVEVRDTGIGMSKEGLSNLFVEFSQAEQDTAQKFGGTGLGLALTKRFCTLMGGTISVTSQPGEGSSFIIDIPCRSAAAAGSAISAAA